MNKLIAAAVVFLLSSGLAGAAPDAGDGYKPVIRVTPLLQTTTTAAGQPIVYPAVKDPQVTAVRVEIPPGAETGWHKHPFPCFGYILSGELLVEMEGRPANRVVAGQALVESVNVRHNGRNLGPEPVTLVMFVTGEKGLPFSVKAAAPDGKQD